MVRDTLDTATEELHVALPEARLAAEAAALRGDEEEPSLEDLEREAASLPPTAAEQAAEAGETAITEPAEQGGTGATAGAEGEAEAVAEAEPEAAEAEGNGREGRRSSSVNVIKRDEPEPEPAADQAEAAAEEPAANGSDDEGNVSSLFARLKEETETPATAEAEPGEGAVAVVVEEVVEVIVVVEATGDPDEPFELVEEIVVDQTVVEIIEEEERRGARPGPGAGGAAGRGHGRARAHPRLAASSGSCPTSRTSCSTPSAARRASPRWTRCCRSWTSTCRATATSPCPAWSRRPRRGPTCSTASGPAPKTKVGDLADELAEELIEPLRDRIENCFREAAGDDEDLAERLRACYREWKGQRVDEATTRLALAAANRGLLDRLKPGTLVHWIVDDGDEPVTGLRRQRPGRGTCPRASRSRPGTSPRPISARTAAAWSPPARADLRPGGRSRARPRSYPGGCLLG